MTTPPPPLARRRRLLVALALGLVVLAAGCGTFEALGDTSDRLRDAGFGDVDVSVDQQRFGDLLVTADAPRGATATEGQEQAAEVVWDSFPRRFDVLRTTIDGRGQRWTYAELGDRFGDRPARLERRDLEADWSRFLVSSTLTVLAIAVVGLFALGVVILLLTRASRRRVLDRPMGRPWMPPGHGPVPPPGGWGPAVPPAPGVDLGKGPGPDGPSAPAPPPVPPAWNAPSAPVRPPVPPSAPRPAASTGRGASDARRLGRRPPGRPADDAHTPPGWG